MVGRTDQVGCAVCMFDLQLGIWKMCKRINHISHISMFKQKAKEYGFALATVLLIVVILLSVGLSMLGMSFHSRRQAVVVAAEISATLAAEAAKMADRALDAIQETETICDHLKRDREEAYDQCAADITEAGQDLIAIGTKLLFLSMKRSI